MLNEQKLLMSHHVFGHLGLMQVHVFSILSPGMDFDTGNDAAITLKMNPKATMTLKKLLNVYHDNVSMSNVIVIGEVNHLV